MKARVRELTRRKTVNDYEKRKLDLKRFAVSWVNYYKLADMEVWRDPGNPYYFNSTLTIYSVLSYLI